MTARKSSGESDSDQSLLLRRTAADDYLAFSEFYERHAETLLVYITRQVVDVEVAADLMSETFAVALEKCNQCRARSAGEEVGWLYGIARHQLTHYWRSGKVGKAALSRLGREPAKLTDPEIERVERLADLETLTGQIQIQLDALPPDQRRAIQLRVVEELDYPDVARELEVTEQVVRSRVSRGLRTLAERLGPSAAEAGMGR